MRINGRASTSYAVLDMNHPTALRVRDTVDTGRVRQALTALTTQSASIGRISDVPGSRAVLVADFAPVVAAMKHVVDDVNRLSVAPAPFVPPPPK